MVPFDRANARNGDQLYNRVAELRAQRKLSRQELADKLEINFQTVGYLERGDYNPSLELAFRISEFFGVSIEMVFSRKPFDNIGDNKNKGSTRR
jgi:putative transcriptional regulator